MAERQVGKLGSDSRGAKDLSVIIARKNPVVDNIATGTELFDSGYRIVKGEDPPSILSLKRKEKKRLKPPLPPRIAAAEQGR